MLGVYCAACALVASAGALIPDSNRHDGDRLISTPDERTVVLPHLLAEQQTLAIGAAANVFRMPVAPHGSSLNLGAASFDVAAGPAPTQPFEPAAYQKRVSLMRHETTSPSAACSLCGWKMFDNDDSTVGYNLWNSSSWGNLLSEYWEARGLTAITGRGFHRTNSALGWLSHLPAVASAYPQSRNQSWYASTCARCNKTMFAHACPGAWTKIRSIVQNDTHHALTEYESKNPAVDAKQADETDGVHVLFHARLDFTASQVWWPARSSFAGKIPSQTKKVTILHMPYTDEQVEVERKKGHVHQTYVPEMQKNIKVVLDGYKKMLSQSCAGCEVAFSVGTQYSDFALIARHKGPIFCMGSSFCLWAAYANIHGPVYFPETMATLGRKIHDPLSDIKDGRGDGFFWNFGASIHNSMINNFKHTSASDLVKWVNAH